MYLCNFRFQEGLTLPISFLVVLLLLLFLSHISLNVPERENPGELSFLVGRTASEDWSLLSLGLCHILEIFFCLFLVLVLLTSSIT